MTLNEAVAIFLDAKLADGLAMTTVCWYKQRLDRLAAFLEEADLDAVTVFDLRRFVVSLRVAADLQHDHPGGGRPVGLSVATRHGYVRAIRQFFAWLVREGCIADNPSRTIKLPQLPKCEPRGVEPETLRALLKATEGGEPGEQRDHAMILFLADTGCRVGGLVGLRLHELDLPQRVAAVTEKGDKTRRVMFTDKTAQALRVYLQSRLVDSAWVFPNLKTGDKMLATSVNHILARVRKRSSAAGGTCNPHAFRHAFAREYILNGGDLATLSEILGHAEISVTKHYYSNFFFGELQAKHRRFSPVAQLDKAPHGE